MRIGVIADIHGNLQALEAVLEDMKPFAPDILIVAGDMVGGGSQSREVLELLSAVDHIAIRGTHEDLLLIVSRGEENGINMFVEAARYETEVLGQEWIDYLAMLPDHRYLDVCSKEDVCVAHGIPGDTSRTIIDPARDHLVGQHLRDRFLTPQEMNTFFDQLKSSLFITAHSHMQLSRYVGHTHVVNPGCVRGEYTICGDQLLAEYAILDLFHTTQGAEIWKATFRQISWDQESMYGELHRALHRYPCFHQLIDYHRNLVTFLNERIRRAGELE